MDESRDTESGSLAKTEARLKSLFPDDDDCIEVCSFGGAKRRIPVRPLAPVMDDPALPSAT